MNFRFLHAADIHLDSPLRGLSAYEGAPVEQFRNATREALRNLVNQAIESNAAFVVIAGDLYDGDWPDFSTGLFLIKELERLNAVGIRVVILFGNHDAESKITKSLPWPNNVHCFNYKRPETIFFEDLRVALHGQSFAHMDVKENLAEGYPAPLPGSLNIGVLHTALQGNARHASYAPCSLAQLQNKGYAYWALGHVHAYEILSRDPWVVFPGNLQGRHIRETGAKGCVAVSVQDGQIVDVERVILDVVRWIDSEVDVASCDGIQAVKSRCADAVHAAIGEQAEKKPAALRVRITGQTESHAELVADINQVEAELQATMLGLPDCWLESVKVLTTPPSRHGTAGSAEAAELLATLLADADSDPGLKANLQNSLKPLLERIPSEIEGHEAGDEANDAPLLTALRKKDFTTLIRSVLPDLRGIVASR